MFYCYGPNKTMKQVDASYAAQSGETVVEMVFCYFNNGDGVKVVPKTYVAQAGELTFPAELTSMQLCAAFPSQIVEQKAKQINVLTLACQSAILAGFTSTALGSAHIYPNTAVDQMNLSASVSLSLLPTADSAAVYPFWCADAGNVWVMRNHTAAQIQKVGSDAYAYVLTQRQRLVTVSAQVTAATTIEQVLSITW